MTLRLRAVRVRSWTREGAFGRQVQFQDGLNILRGGNSRGKTQIVQAVIYALGLERMLQARANVPLGSALTSELRAGAGETDAAIPVEKSWVAVEFATSTGEVITVQRYAKHDQFHQDLVRVWYGPALTDPANISEVVPTEMFLYRPGSATHAVGFHKLLADSAGWTLPSVATYSGTIATLYLEVLFPFIIVDQQSWGSAAPRKVDRFQIREPLRRAAEFLLGLEGPEAEARRGELEQEMVSQRTRWAEGRSAVQTLAQAVGGRVTGLPEHAAGAQARASTPDPSSLSGVRLEVLDDEEWVQLGEVVSALGADLQALEKAGARTIPSGVDELTRRLLDEARAELGDLVAAARLIENDLSMEEAQLAALDRRLAMLEEERARNTDIRTLIQLGSDVATRHLADHNCPTCRQSLDSVESGSLGPVLSVDETVSLLNAQISTASKMRSSSQGAVTQAGGAYSALQRQADQVRATVMALEDDLVAPASSPSAGDIARRITLQLRLDELQRTQSAVEGRLEALSQTAREIATLRADISGLPAGVPQSDMVRLLRVTAAVRTRLTATRFGSYDVTDVELDNDSLRPTRAGFDMDTDVSASDVVRIKAAYLDAVRVEGQTQGRHPGLLILDEPRQQDIDPTDFAAMLSYLAGSNVDGGQVIVTSATPHPALMDLLGSVTARVVDLGNQRLLQLEDDVSLLDIE